MRMPIIFTLLLWAGAARPTPTEAAPNTSDWLIAYEAEQRIYAAFRANLVKQCFRTGCNFYMPSLEELRNQSAAAELTGVSGE